MPGFRTNVGFLAGHAGALVDLTLRDRAGTVVATRPGALSLGSRALLAAAPLRPLPRNDDPRAGDARGDAERRGRSTSTPRSSTTAPATRSSIPSPSATRCSPPNFSVDEPLRARTPASRASINAGTVLSRVDVDTARYPDALCNDGTPGVFYVRRGTRRELEPMDPLSRGGRILQLGDACAKRWCSIDTALRRDEDVEPLRAAGRRSAAAASSRRARTAPSATSRGSGSTTAAPTPGRDGPADRPLVDSTGRPYTIHFQGRGSSRPSSTSCGPA